jgi:hypothetical protein
MKKILLFILSAQCIYISINAQKFLLLERRWSKDGILTDSVTRQNLSDGWFPVYRADLDTLIMLADRLKNLKKDGLKRKFYYSGDFRSLHLKFDIENIKRTYGDSYEINLTSYGTFGEATVKLSDPRELLGTNQKAIRTFLFYLKRNSKNLSKLKRQ